MARKVLIPEELAVKLAEEWLAPISRGRAPTSFPKLAEYALQEFSKRFERRTIERAVRRVFEKKHITFQTNFVAPPAERNRSLERQLLDRWKGYGVEKFIVIDADEKASSSAAVHTQLGLALAEVVSDSLGPGLIGDGERVGIGSGRAISAVVDGLLQTKPINKKNVSLMSLTGNLYPHYRTSHGATIVDADANLQRFMPHFISEIEVMLMSCQISYDDIKKERENRWISVTKEVYENGIRREQIPDYVQNQLPTLTFIGTGSLEPGHRLYDFLRQEKNNDVDVHRYFQSIVEPLRQLYKANNRIHDNYGFTPTADICNRYFIVEPPLHLHNDKKLRRTLKKMQKIVDNEINCKLMTVTKTLLSHVPRNIMIAGTKNKSLSIRTTLERQLVKLNIVCINHTLARELLP